MRVSSGKFRLNRILALRYLIVLGFVIAVIPLFSAVMYAAYGLRDTSALGRTINSQVFEQTKAVQTVLAKTADTERKARLFILLSDPSIRDPYELKSYESTRASLKQAFDELLKLHVNDRIVLLVNEISAKENLIYKQVMGSIDESAVKLSIDQEFRGLRDSANLLSREFETRVDEQFEQLRRQSDALEQSLLTKGAVLLMISFVFIGLLLAILSRSMRQLDTSIRRLGSGELDEPIDVTGPSDMRFLGDRLEWLRNHLLDLEVSKQQFIQNVAREIDSPIQKIRNCADLLLDADRKSNDAQPEIAKRLIDHSDKLKSVSEELRRYSQITSKRETERKDTVNMKNLLDSVIEAYRPLLEHKSLSIKELVRPVEISGIHEQLRIVVEQLMSNAVKFSPPGGEIRIMLRDSGDRMEMEFEDEGPGIAPDERLHVFEPFFRGTNQSQGDAEDAPGPGLGLAIVKEYVDNHQGRVEMIEARQDQHGARVRVQIPLGGNR